jgi:nicotinamide mononucleotide adenylyltransferase
MLTTGQTEYQPTAQVLDHFHHEINEVLGGIDDGTGKKVPAKIALLGGADLVETFVQPGVWSPVDLHHILVDCMCTIEKQRKDLADHTCSRRLHHRADRHGPG